MFDNTVEPGWARFSSSGLAQWGPKVTADFLGIKRGSGLASFTREGGYGVLPAFHELCSVINALREDNEFDVQRLLGVVKGARS